MDMVFLYEKGLGNDREPLVDFAGKFLVAIWEQFFQFFRGQSMVKDTGGKALEIIFPFGLALPGMRGYRDLGDCWFFGFIAEKLRFIEDLKEGQLVHLVKLLGLAAEGALVHQCDLSR